MLVATAIIIRVRGKEAIADAPAIKECPAIKMTPMSNVRRDILMMLKNEFMNKRAIEHEIECLNELLRSVESSRQFCIAHELVDRNHISSRAKKILHAIRLPELRPFKFLICKN